MADTKFSSLDPTAALTDAHIFPSVVGITPEKVTAAQIKAFVNAWTLIKKTDQAQVKNANIVLVADDQLTFTCPANAVMSFKFKIFFSTTAAGDFKWRLLGSVAPTLVAFASVQAATGTAGTTNSYTGFSAADVPVLGTGTTGFIQLEGVIHNGANACVVTFNWAQNTSNAGDTRVLSGSHLEIMTV